MAASPGAASLRKTLGNGPAILRQVGADEATAPPRVWVAVGDQPDSQGADSWFQAGAGGQARLLRQPAEGAGQRGPKKKRYYRDHRVGESGEFLRVGLRSRPAETPVCWVELAQYRDYDYSSVKL